MNKDLQVLCVVLTFISLIVGSLIGYNLHVEAEKRKIQEFEIELKALLYRECLNHPKSQESITWCKF